MDGYFGPLRGLYWFRLCTIGRSEQYNEIAWKVFVFASHSNASSSITTIIIIKIIRWCLISKAKSRQNVLKKVLSLIVFSRSACANSFAEWMRICICRSCVTNELIQPIGIRHKKGCLASIRNLHKFNILWEWKWWSWFQWQRKAEPSLVGPNRRSEYVVFDFCLHHFYFRALFFRFGFAREDKTLTSVLASTQFYEKPRKIIGYFQNVRWVIWNK